MNDPLLAPFERHKTQEIVVRDRNAPFRPSVEPHFSILVFTFSPWMSRKVEPRTSPPLNLSIHSNEHGRTLHQPLCSRAVAFVSGF